jgi:putative transposase
MSNYKRLFVPGGTYFITQVTYQREPWLCGEIGRTALREAIKKVQQKYPFAIDAFVLLPEHFHCIWTLPADDQDFSVRLRLIKTFVTKGYGHQLAIAREISESRQKQSEEKAIFGNVGFGNI